MINVTESAVKQLRSLLEAQPASEKKGLRVQVAKGGCSGLQYEMALDHPKKRRWSHPDAEPSVLGRAARRRVTMTACPGTGSAVDSLHQPQAPI